VDAVIRLEEMTAAGFSEFKPLLVERYAHGIARNHRVPIEEARVKAAGQIDGLLKSGLSTPNQFLYDIWSGDANTADRIGCLWLDVDVAKDRCFICDIYLLEGYRGKGCGRKTLELLEAQMRKRNIHRIGLHVWGDNVVARELYDRLGYQVCGLDMQKLLEGSGDTANDH
jgi:ribosomal protein S18 acetylase RimI-like enzyme